jgi:hypothetical protein
MMKTCTDMGVDITGNTIYTGIAFPTPTTNVPWPTLMINSTAGQPGGNKGGLSLSDKISLGVGIGIGVPTILVSVVAWLFTRKPKGKDSKTNDLN